MRKLLSFFLIAFIILTGITASWAITPEEAQQHIGQNQTVCGTVASAHYANRTKGQPTFLNIDRPYPNQIFTVLIWGNKRSLFPDAPEKYYSGKKICVTGTITSYRGTPEIVVNGPGQIKE
jgi:DNA/RNA endonuclease YhcR with UshA esterase domain